MEKEKAKKQKSRIVGDSIVVGILFALGLTVVQRLVGFGRGILFCRILAEDQLGQWSMIYSFLLLLAPLAVLGLPGSFGRYVEHYRSRGQLGTFLKWMTSISAIAAFVLAIAMLVFPGPFGWIIFRNAELHSLVYLMASALISVAVFNYVTSLLEALCQVRRVSIMRFISAIAFAGFGIAFSIIWQDGVAGVTVGFAVGCALGSLPGLWYLVAVRKELTNHGEPLSQKSLWAKILPFATWMWLINLVSNVYEVADRTMLLHLSPGTDQQVQSYVGQYHSGRVLPLMLVGVAVVLYGFLMPYLTAYWEQGQFEKAKQQLSWTVKAVALGFTGIGLGMLMCSPFLFETVLQGRYNDGLAVLPLTLVYCIWYSLVTVGQDYLWCAEKGKMALLAVAFGLLVNIVVNFFLIPIYGLTGAVTATAISNLVCLLSLYLINQKYGWKLDRGIWLTIAFPLILLLPLLAASISFILLVWFAIRFNWIFQAAEKRLLWQTMEKSLSKLGWGNRQRAAAG